MNHGNQHSIRNLQLGRQRYGTFKKEPAFPNGNFTGTYSGWPTRANSGAMLPTGYLESRMYRTNYSSDTWNTFVHDAESRGKWANGLLLGFMIGIGMYAVSGLMDKVVK